MDNKDIFEILGINEREDSYTDLIKYAFEKSLDFKRKFCEFFAHYYNEDFSLSIRNKDTSIIVSDKKTEIPDMLLYSKQTSEIILIENKIFSGEGYRQTERYSDCTFIDRVKSNLVMPNAKFEKFYFVTLDGKNAKCDKFISITWSKMIQECCHNIVFTDLRLSILMGDLNLRSEHYANFNRPDSDMCFEKYVSTRSKWVDEHRAFKLFFNEITEKLQMIYPFFVIDYSSANNANGQQLLIVFFNSSWNGVGIEKDTSDNINLDNETFRNLHIELNWTPKLYKLSLFIHYETNPYKTQKELDEIKYTQKRKNIEQFIIHRERFQKELYKRVPNGWHKVGRALTLIKTDCLLRPDSTHQEIENWLFKEIRVAYACIEDTLATI